MSKIFTKHRKGRGIGAILYRQQGGSEQNLTRVYPASPDVKPGEIVTQTLAHHTLFHHKLLCWKVTCSVTFWVPNLLGVSRGGVTTCPWLPHGRPYP